MYYRFLGGLDNIPSCVEKKASPEVEFTYVFKAAIEIKLLSWITLIIFTVFFDLFSSF